MYFVLCLKLLHLKFYSKFKTILYPSIRFKQGPPFFFWNCGRWRCSSREKVVGFLFPIFFCLKKHNHFLFPPTVNPVMNLAAGYHSSTLFFFCSLVTTVNGVKIDVSKFTLILMPSIISGLFSLSTYSSSLACSISSLSSSMFLLLLSDKLFVEIAMNSFLVILLKILWAFFI